MDVGWKKLNFESVSLAAVCKSDDSLQESL